MDNLRWDVMYAFGKFICSQEEFNFALDEKGKGCREVVFVSMCNAGAVAKTSEYVRFRTPA